MEGPCSLRNFVAPSLSQMTMSNRLLRRQPAQCSVPNVDLGKQSAAVLLCIGGAVPAQQPQDRGHMTNQVSQCRKMLRR